MNEKNILLIICISVFLFNIILSFSGCPYHVDYIAYSNSIDGFYEYGKIDDNVNGKYVYVYVMAILITPLHLLGVNTFSSMIIITGLFQAIFIYLFFVTLRIKRHTDALLKTLLMLSTLTFLMFIGQPETIMLSSIFLLLFFANRDKPYSEFFIMLASLIRIDSAIFYLFSRRKTAIIPITFTFLQWLNGRFFIHSDFGLNKHIFSAVLVFVLSYGLYFILFLGMAKRKEKNIDWLIHLAIILFIIIFLKFPSQKVFFFPVMLSFILYDFKIKKDYIYVVAAFMIINILLAGTMQYNRAELCTSDAFYEYGLKHTESIYFGIFQPYLDYLGLEEKPPYNSMITQACSDSEDYVIAEDWRNGQLFFLSYKFCLKEYGIE